MAAVCSGLLSVAVVSTMTESNLGRREFVSAHRLWSIVEGGQDGNARQESEGRD